MPHFYHKTLIAGLLSTLAITLAGCSAEEISLDGGKKSSAQSTDNNPSSGDATQGPLDVQQTCGVPAGSLSTPGTQLFQQSLASLPIVVQGTSMMVGYAVSTVASVNVLSKSDQTTQSIVVSVADVKVSSNILGIPLAIAKKKAAKAAEEKSGDVTSVRLSNGSWLNLTSGGNPEYQGLFCAVTGSSSIKNNTGGASGQVDFAPALVNTISPLAPAATLDKELAAPRVFHVTANIKASREGWATGSQAGTITITPISPSVQVGGQTIAADRAYEVRADFPVPAYKLGLSRNQKFFINTSTHTIEAIIDDSGNTDPQSKTELPPTVLLRQ